MEKAWNKFKIGRHWLMPVFCMNYVLMRYFRLYDWRQQQPKVLEERCSCTYSFGPCAFAYDIHLKYRIWMLEPSNHSTGLHQKLSPTQLFISSCLQMVGCLDHREIFE